MLSSYAFCLGRLHGVNLDDYNAESPFVEVEVVTLVHRFHLGGKNFVGAEEDKISKEGSSDLGFILVDVGIFVF